MIGLWVMVAAAWADCTEPVTAGALNQDISIGEAAYLNMDEGGFREGWASVQDRLPCLSEPVTDTLVIAYFRMAALEAFLDRDEAGGTAALRALLARSPGYTLSPSLAPENHPLQAWMTTAFENPATLTVGFTPPRDGTVWVDGTVAGMVLPADRPYIFQYADEDGVMVTSALVRPGEAPPVQGKARPERSLNMPLLITAGAAAVASGGAYALARQRETTFNDPLTADSELLALRRQTNTLSVLSVSAGVAAVGTGAMAFISGEW